MPMMPTSVADGLSTVSFAEYGAVVSDLIERAAKRYDWKETIRLLELLRATCDDKLKQMNDSLESV